MPIEYPGDGGGVLAEHLAVRERVGLFDVSHLGKLEVSGGGASEFLNGILTNDLNRIGDGGAQYTLICEPQTGGVIDDLIIYRRSSADFLLIPNAANAAEVRDRITVAAPSGITVKDRHRALGVIALQGPLANEVLTALGLNLDLDYMSFAQTAISGFEVTICRTGYTGERGYEIVAKWGECVDIWRELEGEVNRFGGRIAGLGARDTLRTEMAYPLHGHELSLSISPVMAGASWAIGWSKAAFWGDSILRAQRSEGTAQTLRALKLADRGVPRAGMQVLLGTDVVGEITSGTFSPSLKIGIALALVDSKIPIGTQLSVDIRGRKINAEVVKPPFVPSKVR